VLRHIIAQVCCWKDLLPRASINKK